MQKKSQAKICLSFTLKSAETLETLEHRNARTTRENILTFAYAILAKLQMEGNSNQEYWLLLRKATSPIARMAEYFNKDPNGKKDKQSETK